MGKLLISIFFILYCVLHRSEALKILGIFPHEGKSHFDVFEPLLKALAQKGHHVTVISHFPQKVVIPNYRDISIRQDSIYLDVVNVRELPTSHFKFVGGTAQIHTFAQKSCPLLQTKNMQKLANSNETFDVAIVEFFNSDCFLGFVHKFKVPFIGVSSHTIMPWTSERLATSANPAYVPVLFSPFSDKMNFVSRVENTIYYLYSLVYYNYFMLPDAEREAKKLFGNTIPPLDQIARNASLFLLNTHFTLSRPKPFVPNIVEVGGMFLKDHNKIPKNLEKWINESSHGVIYLSMGSMIKGHSFPPETRAAFIRAFDRLPQRVLWKWENETLPGKTDKIMIQKWMPQFDILCHPNVKAYIAHGGLLGTTEAVHCGVPAVVLPQYGDQFVNAAALQEGGGGVVLDFKTVTEDIIYEALKKILDPNFKKQAEDLSARFRDRPMPPLETAIYWVEYVARHKGAHHMKTAAVGMPWYQYLLFDVIAFLAAILISLLLILYFSTRALFRLIFSQSKKIKNE